MNNKTDNLNMRKTTLALVLACASISGWANEPLSLDSCRSMALRNNKALQIAQERVRAAEYKQKEARAAYLPGIDLTASYIYNSKEISLLADDQMLPTMSFNPATGQYQYNILTGADGMPVTSNGQYVPTQVAVIPKEAMTFDIQNVFGGAVTLTQPIYMGGKIIALNKMASLAKDIAEEMRSAAEKEVVYSVDAAYWQVVSLCEKKKLADSYIQLLDTLQRNVRAMISEGVATNADLLNVEVKLNEANIDLVKVTNGLTLSRMALAQICGLPLDAAPTLADEMAEAKQYRLLPKHEYTMNDVYANRSDLKSLEMAVKVYEQKQNVERSAMLPNLALVGAYSMTNPNAYDGVEKEFGGMFSVGAMLKIPIWHWGGNHNKMKSVKTDTQIKRFELEEAREKIELQVTQANFKAAEAAKKLETTKTNLDKASENLRQAQLGYTEGVMPIDNVMAAQTAWLKANSEYIDAEIDVQLCDVYLSKVVGMMTY